VTGKLPPTKVNPVPDTVVELTVTGEVPLEVSVSVFVVGVFIDTFPKFKVPVFTVNCGAAAIPVPLRSKFITPLPVASLLIRNWPVTAPVTVGLNWICNVND